MIDSTKTDATAEKRRTPRIDAMNMVEYALYDEKKNKIGHGKACTVNLSQTGTLVQTKDRIDGAFIILMTIDLNGNKIKVSGKVVTSRICRKTGGYLTGVEFIGPKDKQLKAVIAFVKAYQRKKYSDEISFDDLNTI
jgi:c-di-GMP-binding flagellar brake protein YcgR